MDAGERHDDEDAPAPDVAGPDGEPQFVGTDGSVAVRAAVGGLRCVDVPSLEDTACLGVLDDLEAAQRTLDAVRMQVVFEVDQRGLTDRRYGAVTSQWLSRRHGGPAADVKRDIRVGRTLRGRLPLVAAALAGGRLSTARAAVIARAVNDRNAGALADRQDELLDLAATRSTFSVFKAEVEGLAELLDDDGGHDPEPGHSRLSMSRTGDELHLRGVFVGDVGVEVEQLLNGQGDREFRAARDDEAASPADLPMPGRAGLLAIGLWSLLRQGAAAGPRPGSGPLTHVSLVVREPGPLEPSELVWGLPRITCDHHGHRLVGLDVMLCDAKVTPVTVTVRGVPIGISEDPEDRFANRGQRRAAAVRDGGCVFPGCDAPMSWTDQHHVIEHGNGGPTVMRNLASLCRRHHGVVHRSGWSMRTVEAERFEITTPTGAVLRSQRHGRPAPT